MFFKIFFSFLLFALPILAQKPATQHKKNLAAVEKTEPKGKGGLLDLFNEPEADIRYFDEEVVEISKKEILQTKIDRLVTSAKFWADERKDKSEDLRKVYFDYSMDCLKEAEALLKELHELNEPKQKKEKKIIIIFL